MFCKECGTENLDIEVECKKCKTIINSNFRLSGTERVMIIGFFVGLALTLIFGIIPIIICLAFIYIIKKDKNIKLLKTAKKIFLGYLIILGLILSISCFNYALDNKDYFKKSYKEYYEKYLETKDIKYLEWSNDYKNLTLEAISIGLIVVPLGAYLIYFISNVLFFNILKRHETWIVNNGIFADYKDEKSFIEKATEKIKIIKKESTNTADELLKWAELKEKGLITDEEFQKAKDKILKGIL